MWSPVLVDVLKFNLDGVASEKLGLAGVGGVLSVCNSDDGVLVMFVFSKYVGNMESTELLTFLALWIFVTYFHVKLIVESDSRNAVS